MIQRCHAAAPKLAVLPQILPGPVRRGLTRRFKAIRNYVPKWRRNYDDMMLTHEEAVGITEWTNSLPGFSVILKQRRVSMMQGPFTCVPD